MTSGSPLQEFIILWAVIDPFGTIPVFLAATAGMSTSARRSVAIRAVIIAFGVLVAFILAGQLVLDALGIDLPSFQIAGGIVLFVFAMSMIFGPSKPQSEIDSIDRAKQVSVFPVAIPSIASPGAMLAVVVLTDNDRFSLIHQAMTTAAMTVVLAVTLGLLLLATPIHRVIGMTGEMIISRIMGMILAAVAVDAIVNALRVLGVVPPS